MSAKKPKLSIAISIFLVACFFISASGACSKLISHQVSIYTILFFQNVIGLFLTIPRVVHKGWTSLKTEKWPLHLVRDIVGLLIFFFLFSSLRSLPLLDAILLNNTAPLWIPLIALVWPRVVMHNRVWWGVIIGFAGVVLILKPGKEAFTIGAIFALASGFCVGLALLVVGKLSKTEPTDRILFYYFLVGIIISAPFAFYNFSQPSWLDMLYLCAVGLFVFLAQLLVTYSFLHAKVTVLAPLTYITVVYSGLFDWLIWNHFPSRLTYLGILLVIFGAILAIYFEQRYQKKLTDSS